MHRKNSPADHFSLVATFAIFLFILIESTESKSLVREMKSKLGNISHVSETVRESRKLQLYSKSLCDCKNHVFKEPSARPEDTTREERIILGNTAEAGDFPWQVMLQKFDVESNKWTFQCGGVLISDKFVVTAEHCMGPDKKHFRLIVGSLNRKEAESQVENHYEIDQYISYRERPTVQHEHDIALLKIKKVGSKHGDGVTCNNHVQPICLEQAPNFEAGKRCFISGWGSTENGKTSEELLFAKIPLQSSKTCEAIFNDKKEISFDRFTSNMLCSGSVGHGYSTESKVSPDSCQGDSGGPLACVDEGTSTAYLTGVVSFGIGKCGYGPSVYVKVSKYVEWIREEINAWK